MTLRHLFLIPFLLLGACTAEESTSEGHSGVEPGFLEGENGEDKLAGAASEQGSEAAQRQPLVPPGAGNSSAGQDPLVPPGGVAADYEPRREPQFHFETEQVSDEELDDYYVEMSLEVAGKDVGTMSFVFWPEKAPIAVRNFLRYCDEGFYDGLVFHRILRDFMMQGGSPDNTGAGSGPHGQIQAEFSDEREYDHRYGVLSMARSGDPNSASSQFFVICGESESTVGLNGQYTSFGMMVNGVDTLEAAASVPVGFSPMNPREKSAPQQKVVITKAVVKQGEPPQTEPVEAPKPDLGGEPERVSVQHVLISMAGTPVQGVTRTKEEAKKLAEDILKRARNGEDFGAIVVEYTDDKASIESTPPGRYRMLNDGVFDYEATRESFAIQKEVATIREPLVEKVQKGELTPQDASKEFQSQVEAAGLLKRLTEAQWMPRGGMVPGFGEVAFSLAVGEVGLVEYSADKSPFGWHIIKRIQ